MAAITLSEARSEARYFYVWMAVVCVVVAFGSFAGTYWFQVPAGTFVGDPLVHLHAIVFSLWPLWLLGQTWRAAQGRIEHHRAWGVAGVSLATAMLMLGVAAAGNSMAHGIETGYGERARAFLIVPLTGIGLFAVFFAAAVANLSRPDWHKRLMLVATAAVLQAAVARIVFLAKTGGGPGVRPGIGPPLPVDGALMGALLASALLLAGVVYDWRTRGRPHAAYLIGIATIIVVGAVRIPISVTPQWMAFADFLGRLTG